MFESFSALGSFVQTPCGPRKSGMPDSVEMPAPVSATMRVAAATQRRTSSTGVSITFFVPAELYCAQRLEGGCDGSPSRHDDDRARAPGRRFRARRRGAEPEGDYHSAA